MNLIDMDELRKDLMAKGDIPIHEIFNTIWDQPLVKAIPKEKIDEICKKLEEQKENEHPLDYNVRAVYSKVIIMLQEACDGD